MEYSKSIKVMCMALLSIGFISNAYTQESSIMETTKEIKVEQDNTNKSILARGCDPEISQWFSEMVPPLIGNAEYIPTTSDTEFFRLLESQKWSVVFFAPGACRYSAAEKQIPGGNIDSQGWTLDQYKELIIELQGADIQIVESLYEEGTIELLKAALEKAPEVK